jgi:hypothetical protein
LNKTVLAIMSVRGSSATSGDVRFSPLLDIERTSLGLPSVYECGA